MTDQIVTEVSELEAEIARLTAERDEAIRQADQIAAAAAKERDRLKAVTTKREQTIVEQREELERVRKDAANAVAHVERASTVESAIADRILPVLAKMERISSMLSEQEGDNGQQTRDHPALAAARFALSGLPLTTVRAMESQTRNRRTYYGSADKLAYAQKRWDDACNNPQVSQQEQMKAKADLYMAQLLHMEIIEPLHEMACGLYQAATGESFEDLRNRLFGQKKADPKAESALADLDAVMNA